MKKTFSAVRFLKLLAPAVALLVAGAAGANAQIIPSNTVIDWTNVGVRGGIPVRTNLIDVTRSPYNADNTGHVDATTAIQNAINGAPANSVVYIPDGRYLIASWLYCYKSDITIRGHTNSVLMGVGTVGYMLKIGQDPGNYMGNVTDTIISGSTRGSTNITLSTTPTFSVGHQIAITESTAGLTSGNPPIISVHQYDHILQQEVTATTISGNVVTISDPLMWDFTNAPAVIAWNPSFKRVGLENLILTGTNALTRATGSYGTQLSMTDCSDCWVSNCAVLWSHNYAFGTTYSSHLTIIHNTIQFSQGSGSNHSGFSTAVTGGSLYADNIIADGMQPGFEFGGGFCGNVMFANYFTNNVIGIDNHGPHPMMNLWEANIMEGNGAYFEMDGYFGSGSHQTLLRNSIGDSWAPVYFKRWSTYMNLVGNVLGQSGGGYSAYSSEGNGVGHQIVQIGYPNIGNDSYVAGPSAAWNFPLNPYPAIDSCGNAYAMPVFTFTSSQGPTTNLVGNFSSIVPGMANLLGIYSIQIQDHSNTNLYYPTNGVPIYPIAGGTATNLRLNTPVTVKAGDKLFVVGQLAYQQLQQNDKNTDTITGNYDYYNNSLTWDANGVQSIPTSLIYPNGAPSWWGANRWPAVQPDASPMVSTIPAQLRYRGIQTQFAPQTGPVLPPSQLKAGP